MPDVIVLDRAHPFGKPDYCIHGETLCVACERACWLGSESIEVVKSGVLPLCLECANAQIPPGHAPSHNVADHLRSQGPH